MRQGLEVEFERRCPEEIMHKLPAVEDARAVMTEGINWSAWRWLIEKRRVREIADRLRLRSIARTKK